MCLKMEQESLTQHSNLCLKIHNFLPPLVNTVKSKLTLLMLRCIRTLVELSPCAATQVPYARFSLFQYANYM